MTNTVKCRTVWTSSVYPQWGGDTPLFNLVCLVLQNQELNRLTHLIIIYYMFYMALTKAFAGALPCLNINMAFLSYMSHSGYMMMRFLRPFTWWKVEIGWWNNSVITILCPEKKILNAHIRLCIKDGFKSNKNDKPKTVMTDTLKKHAKI